MGMDIYGRKPANKTGEYFRANVWSWRPIHYLCELVMDSKYPDWAYNDGDGLFNQKDCDTLANKLENYLNKNPNDEISIESDCRVDDKNKFLPTGATGGKSAYYTTHDHVRNFIKFLRACGGFKIY